MDPILAGLNPAQEAGVTHGAGPLLVVAGAGSGKTRVITRRIAWLVRSGLAPSEVLAITFTNKAAGEMRERVTQLLGPNGMWISTFHALGARLLRIESEAAGLSRNFTILDDSDQLAVMREVFAELGLKSREHRPQEFRFHISRCKNAGEGPPADAPESDDVYDRVYAAYEAALRASECLDFDDLLLRPVRMLEGNEAVRTRIAGRFRTLLIDEYQDTNVLQYRLARALVRDHSNICATGDPDQSIYRWRGADIRNILEFERDFPGAKVVKLEENYRSSNRILKAASALIRHNTQRVERDLWSALGEGEPIRVVEAYTEADEAREIVSGIGQAFDDSYRPEDIAVFYRTNACSRPIEQALARANVPYVIVGAVEFYERREIKDLLAYLKVAVNPHDAVDLVRILNVPARGIGAKTIANLREAARTEARPLLDVLLDPSFARDLRGPARGALGEFGVLLRELTGAPRFPTLPLLDMVLERTGYRRWIAEAADPLVEERLENIEELRVALADYDERGTGSLDEFLAETALLRSRADLEPDTPRVTLMTLHAAKGLEFPVVFIAGIEEGVLPHARSFTDEGIEEERRLLYVGMTRAQKRLTLSYARSRAGMGGSYGQSLPSRFLAEIPRELCAADPRRGAAGFEVDETAYYEPAYDSDEPPFNEGDFVVHAEFGAGQVLRLSGFGPTAKVVVAFERHGTKNLILEYARLRKARG